MFIQAVRLQRRELQSGNVLTFPTRFYHYVKAVNAFRRVPVESGAVNTEHWAKGLYAVEYSISYR